MFESQSQESWNEEQSAPRVRAETVLAREEREPFGLATSVRMALAVGALCVVAIGAAGSSPGWHPALRPLGAFALAAWALHLLRHSRLRRLLAWSAALVDASCVYAVVRALLPAAAIPTGVLGVGFGLFALVVALNSLVLRPAVTVSAAVAAATLQSLLFEQAGLPVSYAAGAAIALGVISAAGTLAARRVQTLVQALGWTEAARQAEQSRGDALERAHRTIEGMLSEARARNDELARMQRQRDGLIQLVVHDLRNPLTALDTSLGGLERQMRRADVPQPWQNSVRRALQTSRRLHAMIGELLDIGRLEEGRLEPHQSYFSVEELVRDETVELATCQRNPPIHVDCEIEQGLELHGDRGLVLRVVENLVSNACRYTPETGRILLEAHRDGDDVVLAIHNDGAPIPRERRERLFEKFTQGEGERAGGWGLGLYFCRLAVQAHQGRISIEDVPGWNVSFVVRLPQQKTLH